MKDTRKVCLRVVFTPLLELLLEGFLTDSGTTARTFSLSLSLSSKKQKLLFVRPCESLAPRFTKGVPPFVNPVQTLTGIHTRQKTAEFILFFSSPSSLVSFMEQAQCRRASSSWAHPHLCMLKGFHNERL